MPVGKLTGYAIKMFPGGPDHTYVESSHGHVWPCWGRSSNGTPICDGDGNTMQADCLSQPNSQAGIVYGRTGVCYQTANRILYPSRRTVSPARGCIGSLYFWGAYGRDPTTGQHYSPSNFPWPELHTCLTSHTH
jgi:hypothetical protein